MVLTKNEARLIVYMLRHNRDQLSINGLARQTGITPKGAYKILKKLEKEELVVKTTIANAAIYQLNFQNSKTEDVVRYALKSELAPNKYVKVVQKELRPLQPLVDGLILFGSVLTKGLQAHDLDVVVIIEKKNLARVQSTIRTIEGVIPKKIHPVFQTRADLQKNITKKDLIIMAAIQKGFILNGHDLICALVKHDTSR